MSEINETGYAGITDSGDAERAKHIREKYDSLLAEADALEIPTADPEEMKQNVLGEWKGRRLKDARKYAAKGCFKGGQRPKKRVIEEYTKTDHYKKRLQLYLQNDEVYRKIEDGTILEDAEFLKSVESRVRNFNEKTRSKARKPYALEMRKLARDYMEMIGIRAFGEAHARKIFDRTNAMMDEYIKNDLAYIDVSIPEDYPLLTREPLSADNFDSFLRNDYRNFLPELADGMDAAHVGPQWAVKDTLEEDDPFLKEIAAGEDIGEYADDRLYRYVRSALPELSTLTFLKKQYDTERFTELLSSNPYFGKIVQDVRDKAERTETIRSGILEGIPKHYPDLFPLARAMHRHFTIHVGPTNSGKTYEAIEALKNADSGVYLAPLRLLAYEQYETLNRAGCACTLVTGEERREVPGAELRSSTIEMLDFKHWYDVAVIDEAQMMADDDRGGAWTAAIMGVRAPEIHVCAAPSAENLIKRIVGDCGDTYEVVHHARKTPLIFENSEFRFPRSVKSGDALIVFSRRDVHGVAAELQKAGKKCSIIYGALPYDVRYEEARKFREGETDIVVATDAIGMGLNMPVARIVFLEDEKFDGHSRRPLIASEVQQIAGRAGRYGIYEKGKVNALYDVDELREELMSKVPDDTEAVIAFPEELLRIDAPLSEILTQWAEMEVSPGFRKDLSETEIALSKMLEEISDDKYLIYRFVTMAFDEENEELLGIWREMFVAESHGEVFPAEDFLPRNIPMDGHADDLRKLEQMFHVCDLLYGYLDRFGHPDGIPKVLETKEVISKAIMKILDKQEFGRRYCRECGRPLPWNHPYAICDRCFRKRRYKH